MLATMAAAGLALARGAAAADGPVPAVVVHTHVVLPGETLWGIARQVAPQEDPRDVVARIVEFNALQSASVQAGQRLALPPGLPVAR
jgi:nucleoid-associated protein YgaU